MSSTPIDTRLDCLVREAVANYGSYTATVNGLGEGRADHVLEINVDSEDLTHAYTRAPFNKANKIPPDCRIRHFVYIIPIEQRYGQEQRMLFGSDGNDLSVPTFFRPYSAETEAVYVAMPTQAFSGPGSEVQYAFRVRNYFERPNGLLEPRDDIQIGMELTTKSQSKHPRRGVVLVTNNQLFSFQLGAMGDKQAGFKMQYNPLKLASTESACNDSLAELHTQVFGSMVLPLEPEEIMTKAINKHYYIYTGRRGGGASRGCGKTKGGSSLSHASLVAGEEKHWNLSVSNSVPISKRARVKLSLMVGDITQVFAPDLEHSTVPPALPTVLFAPSDNMPSSLHGYENSMRCLETIRALGISDVEPTKLAQLSADMFKWPVNDGFEALAIGVREHEDKDDDEGEDLSATFTGPGKREYRVKVGSLLRVRVTNMTLGDTCVEVHPFYCKATSECGTCCFWEEYEKSFLLKPGHSYVLPYPLQKDAGEGTDGWVFKNQDGMNLLTVLFKLPADVLDIDDQDDHVAFKALKSAREEDEMVVDTEGEVQKATSGEKVHLECCICLETKTVRQMVTFVPCGHCACCENCYAKQVATDAAACKRSTCPKCRQRVNSTIKVFF